MKKIVSSGENCCTAQLDGTECAVEFSSNYKCFTVQNDTSDDVFVSIKPDIIAGNDGVRRIRSGAASALYHMRNDVNTVYILGTGIVQIVASDEPDNFFKYAPAAGSGGVTNVKWDLSDPYGLCSNIKNTAGYNGGGYNFAGNMANTFGLYQSYSSYNITHSNVVDFSNVKKIVVHGATKSNLIGLSATALCNISGETLTEISDDWIVLNQSVGTDISEFSVEIDCTSISGEKYIHFAVLHGDEYSGNSSYLFIYDIEYIYG